jgi:hypothetical protein
VIVAEAHQESRSIMRAAQNERERLFAEARRVETLLRAALGMVEETRNELPDAGVPEPPGWPNREHTREFQAVPVQSVPEPEPAPEPASEPAPLPPVQEQPEDDGPWAARDFAWG